MSCTLAEFEHLVQENSTLLFPVFDMQLLLRDRTVGSRFLHLQEVKTQRFGPNKPLTEILSSLKHKPDCFLHRNEPKKLTKKPTAASHPAPTPSLTSGHSHGGGGHSPGPHNEAKHKGDKSRKSHADGYHTPTPGSSDTAKSSNRDPTKSDHGHHTPSRKGSVELGDHNKSNHNHSNHNHDSATKSNHDHNKSGHDSPTKHTHDYIATHKTGMDIT